MSGVPSKSLRFAHEHWFIMRVPVTKVTRAAIYGYLSGRRFGYALGLEPTRWQKALP